MEKRTEISARFFNYQLTPLPFLLTTEDKPPDILLAMPVFTSHDIQANYCVKHDYYQ